MYLRDLAAGLRRRWYLVIVGFLLTGGLAAYTYSVAPVTYEARASMLLLPSKAWTEMIGVDNPYLSLTGMGPALDVLTRRVDADRVRLPVERRFPDTEYVISADTSTSGPVVLIETTGPTGARALDVLGRVRSEVEDSLVAMQEELDVSADSQIDLIDVFVDEKATIDMSIVLRLSVAAGIGGVLLTILLTGLIDGLVVNRRARREGVGSNSDSAAKVPIVSMDVPVGPRAEGPAQQPDADAEPVVADAPLAAPAHHPASTPRSANRPTQRIRGSSTNSQLRKR